MAIRFIAQTDDEIKSEHLEQTIDLMKGKKPDAAHHDFASRSGLRPVDNSASPAPPTSASSSVAPGAAGDAHRR